MSKTISSSVRITTILPNPDGVDVGRETVTVSNAQAVSLQGWLLRDMSGHTYELSGSVGVGEEVTFELKDNAFPLNNKGDIIFLSGSTGAIAHRVDYAAKDVSEGVPITFPDPTAPGKPAPAAYISSMLPEPKEGDTDAPYESITIKGLIASAVDLTDWTFKDKAGHSSDLFGELQPGEKKTFVLKPDKVSLNNKGDELVLVDAKGAIVHSVIYSGNQVYSGVYVDFDPPAASPTRGKARLPCVTVASVMPSPAGNKSPKTVTIKVRGRDADLAGWKLRGSSGKEMLLSGKVSKRGQKTLPVPGGDESCMKPEGDKLSLINPAGDDVQVVEYGSEDVTRGVAIDFEITESNLRGVVTRVPTVLITSVLPKPEGREVDRETVTIASRGGLADVSGWKVTNGSGKSIALEGMIGDGKERTYLAGDLSLSSATDGDELKLVSESGEEVHCVTYTNKNVKSGVVIDFGTADAVDSDTGVARLPTVQICSMLPNPDGIDAGREVIVLKARGGSTSLAGWTLVDSAGHMFDLDGEINDGEDKSILLTGKKFALNNKGDTIRLVDADGDTVHAATYDEDEVVSGVLVDFGTTKANALYGRARVPTVMISRVLPDPGDDDALRETVTVKTRGGTADMAGWAIKDKSGNEIKLSGLVDDEKTFLVASLSMSLNDDGEVLSLMDKYQREVHRVRFAASDVVVGKELEF